MIFVFIIITIFFSALFSGMEIALVSSDKLRIEIERKKGGTNSKIISFFIKKAEKFIATMLLGNNIALVIYGILLAKLLEPQLLKLFTGETVVLLFQTLISTIIILFAGEFIPKTIFRLNPNQALNIFAFPVLIIFYLLYPLTIFTIFFSNFFLKYILKSKKDEQKLNSVFGKIDLTNFINKFQNYEDEIDEEVKIIQNTLDFEKIKIRECIVPRNEIIAINKFDNINELKSLITETGFSKILVYEGSIDNIIGYVHSYGLYKNPKQINDILVDIPIVPETMTAQKLFNIMIRKKRSIALVVDEYGGTSGIVTTEDILEEIFGDIQDEHDSNDIISTKTDENTYKFSGRIEIEQINEEFNLNLPKDEDYETLAGYIINNLERFPEKNEILVFDNFQITILEIAPPKIELVELKILSENK